MISRFRNITQANTLKINSHRPFRRNDNNENQNKNSGKSNPNFKGPIDAAMTTGSAFLNLLNVNPAIGACFVDLGFMVTPRTIVDAGRSANAGIETGIREASGTTNHALVGWDGALAAAAVSYGFNKANGVKANKMFMDGATIDALETFVDAAKTADGYNEKAYWTKFFKELKGFNTTLNSNQGSNAANEIWKGLSDKAIEEATDIMVKSGANDYKVPKDAMAKVYEIIVKDIEAGESFKLENTIQKDGKNVSVSAEGSVKSLVEDANAMLKAVKDKAFKEGTKVVEDLPEFLKGVKNRKLATVALGMSIPVAVGMAAQPVNRYLTKKRTGQDGFVGVEGRKPDHSKEFKVLKSIAALGIGSGMIATILEKPKHLYTKPVAAMGEIISKLQFKGKIPTINQFKFIYGMTIMSRLLAARDKNELREGTIKDTLGFFNWLVLGGFVSKGALGLFNRLKLTRGNLLNYDRATNGEGLGKKLIKSVEKSHEEILYPALKKLGISVVDEQGNVRKFGKLYKLMLEKAKASNASAETKEIVAKTVRNIHCKNGAQLLGYLYSGLVLGVGIPKLNIAITKYYDKKHYGDKTESSKMRIPEMSINPDSKTFSAFGAYLQ